ncbi:hypothetical protein [Thermoactinospora rubra]|uniref:hypothetical protein n=1 Tax=Thermoactinospora rubra TaxID=1088767 RepID=UPI000A0F8AB7|nr:hypothetical protein [Thermoactinospora rubra]
MVTVAELVRVVPSAPARRAFLKDHWVFGAALALGAALRLVTMLGYGPAMWFNDSYQYVSVALHPRPDPIRPSGYGFWLLLLKPFHSFSLVVFTQHLMGLATAVLIYVLLRRRFGLPGWGATLAAVPVLFDAYQIQLEQLIMSDTMFTLLVTGVVTLVLWKRRLSWRAGAVVGLLLALTALTRSIGLPILALVTAYLIVKRVGWRPVVAVVVACAVPVLGYMSWFKAANGKVAMTNSDGLILYMRTAVFADCAKMRIDPRKELDIALLCLDKAERKPFAQWYLWGAGQGRNDGTAPEVLHRLPGKKFDEFKNEIAGRFAQRAILSQPGDYLATVWRDFMRSFHWDRPRFPDAKTFNAYNFRANLPPERLPTWSSYGGGRADTDAFMYEQGPPETKIVHPWADVMEGYQKVFFLRGIMLGAILLIGLYGIAVRWRTLGGPVLLPWLAAFGLLLAPAATAEFDYRYVLPAVPLACLAAAITLRRGLRPTSASASGPTTARG